MVFDFGGGISEFGKALSQTAGVALIEEQRASLARENLELASRLASERDSAGRAEAHGYKTIETEQELAAMRGLRGAQEEGVRIESAGKKAAESRAAASSAATSAALGGGVTVSKSYDEAVAGAEKGEENGQPVANKLGSGAWARYQIMPDTWKDLRKDMPDLPEDMRQATKEQHKAAFDTFTAKNASILQKNGVDPTPSNLYLAHRFGAGGAEAVVKAADNTLLSDVLPQKWQSQNPDMKNADGSSKTVGEFKRIADDRMKGVTMDKRPGSDPLLAGVAIGDPGRAAQLSTETTLRREEIGAKKEENSLDRSLKTSESALDRAMHASLAGDLRVTRDGKAFMINKADGKAVEVKNDDGTAMIFSDPVEARNTNEALRMLSQRMTTIEASRSRDIGTLHADLRKLDPMLPSSKAERQSIQDQIDKREKYYDDLTTPLWEEFRDLKGTIINNLEVQRRGGGAGGGTKPPISQFRLRQGTEIEPNPSLLYGGPR